MSTILNFYYKPHGLCNKTNYLIKRQYRMKKNEYKYVINNFLVEGGYTQFYSLEHE